MERKDIGDNVGIMDVSEEDFQKLIHNKSYNKAIDILRKRQEIIDIYERDEKDEVYPNQPESAFTPCNDIKQDI